MLTRATALCAIFCILAAGASARDLQQVPTFQGSGLNIINGADPSAQQTTPATPVQTTPTQQSNVPAQQAAAGLAPTGLAPNAQPPLVLPVTQAQVPAPAPAQATPVLSTPTPAPSNPLPVASAPVPAPNTLVLPNVPAPAPATVLPTVPAPAPAVVLPNVPAPAPVTYNPAPVPAPASALFLPSLVPTPAPVPAPVPAPAPSQFPLCGVRPSCRLFIEDMLCCESAGALTSKQHATMRLQCTHEVNYYPKCFNVTGPTNLTAFNQFETTVWSNTHMAQVSFLDDYMGNVSVNIEGPRTDAVLSGDCGLYVSPCLYGDEIIRQVAPVDGLSFTTIPTEDFIDVANSLTENVDNLDSLVMSNPLGSGTCQQQNLDALDASFFANDWFNYTSGFQSQCNYTAFVEMVAPLSPPSSSVQTASLG